MTVQKHSLIYITTEGSGMMKLLLGALLSFMLAFQSCEKPEPKEGADVEKEAGQKEKPAIPVEAIRVSKSIAARTISVSGTVAGKREAVVVSETQGTLTEVNFSLGQFVKKGADIARVNNTVQKAAWESAKKAFASAKLHLEVTQKLFDAKNASDAELKAAQNGAAGAQAQMDAAEKAYSDCTIKSPISGYVAEKEPGIQTGSFLPPGAKVARIVDLSQLKATVAVGEMEIVMLKKGMPADIKVPAMGGSVFKGKVKAIAAGSDPSTGAYSFEVEWTNTPDKRIKSGMSVRIDVTTQEPDSIFQVPSGAIVERNRKNAVYLSVDGKAVLRFVTLGRVMGNNIEITEGIRSGDVLITSGLRDMKQGEPILATMTTPDGAAK